MDIASLRESLNMEQQRYRQLWDERETVVTSLHGQVRQLQHDRDDYYTKYQELQVSIQMHMYALFILVEFVLPTWEQTFKLNFMKSNVKSLIYTLMCVVVGCFFKSQSKMQECKKRMGEMEAELQKANNRVCHTGHQLNQLTAKVKTLHTAELQLR